MSKKTKTTQKTEQKAQFDPASQAAFQAFTNAAQNALLPLATTDPFQSAQFFLDLQRANQMNSLLGGREQRNVLANVGQMNVSNPGALTAALLARGSRAQSRRQLDSFMDFYNQYVNRGIGIAGNLLNYRPLQTGQTGFSETTQKTSGLGTWLPQVAGMGIAAAMAPFTGGASLLGAGALGRGSMGPGGTPPFLPGAWGSATAGWDDPFGLKRQQSQSPFISPGWGNALNSTRLFG